MSFRRFKNNDLLSQWALYKRLQRELISSLCSGKELKIEIFEELRSERVRCIVKRVYFPGSWEELHCPISYIFGYLIWFAFWFELPTFCSTANPQLTFQLHHGVTKQHQDADKTRASSIQLFFSSKSTVFQLPLASNMTFLVDRRPN